MSTPEERLKQLAEQLESQHTIRQQREQEETRQQRDDLHRRTQEARKEAQAWHDRAQSLITATGKLVPCVLKNDISEGPGFELSIGTSRILAVLRSDGWRVLRTAPEDLYPTSGLPVGDLAQLREQLVERMVGVGLHDLYEGRTRPAPDRYRRGP